jgi:hypothetical protein
MISPNTNVFVNSYLSYCIYDGEFSKNLLWHSKLKKGGMLLFPALGGLWDEGKHGQKIKKFSEIFSFHFSFHFCKLTTKIFLNIFLNI